MKLFNKKNELIDISENDYDLVLSYDKIRKELKLKSFPSEKSYIKIRGKRYKVIGGISGCCYLKQA